MNWALSHDLVQIDNLRITLANSDVTLIELFRETNSDLFYNGDSIVVDVGREDFPCRHVSWFGALAYCNFLSDIHGLNRAIDFSSWEIDLESNGFRPPTEAEWEKAARAGTKHRYPWGNEINHTLANYNSSSFYAYDISETRGPHPNWNRNTSPVGYFAPNAFGIYDVVGNVWEWCLDSSHDYPKDYLNPFYFSEDIYQNKVLRGGSFGLFAFHCDLSFRNRQRPTVVMDEYGIRVVRRP